MIFKIPFEKSFSSTALTLACVASAVTGDAGLASNSHGFPTQGEEEEEQASSTRIFVPNKMRNLRSAGVFDGIDKKAIQESIAQEEPSGRPFKRELENSLVAAQIGEGDITEDSFEDVDLGIIESSTDVQPEGNSTDSLQDFDLDIIGSSIDVQPEGNSTDVQPEGSLQTCDGEFTIYFQTDNTYADNNFRVRKYDGSPQKIIVDAVTDVPGFPGTQGGKKFEFKVEDVCPNQEYFFSAYDSNSFNGQYYITSPFTTRYNGVYPQLIFYSYGYVNVFELPEPPGLADCDLERDAKLTIALDLDSEPKDTLVKILDANGDIVFGTGFKTIEGGASDLFVATVTNLCPLNDYTLVLEDYFGNGIGSGQDKNLYVTNLYDGALLVEETVSFEYTASYPFVIPRPPTPPPTRRPHSSKGKGSKKKGKGGKNMKKGGKKSKSTKKGKKTSAEPSVSPTPLESIEPTAVILSQLILSLTPTTQLELPATPQPQPELSLTPKPQPELSLTVKHNIFERQTDY